MKIDGTRAHDRATELVLAYYAAFNRGDWNAMCTLCAEDVVHDVNQGAREVGRDKLRAFLDDMARCYKEELRHIIVMATYDGSRVAAEFQVIGKYLETADGLPDAHGQTYDLPGGAFFGLEKGKISRITTYYNLTDWRRQVESK